MRTRLRLGLLATLVAAMGLLLAPGTAFAQYSPSGDDFISTTPNPAAPGDDVDGTAGYFQANSPVDVLVEASVLLDTTVIADSDGVIDFDFHIPEDHPNGTFKVTLKGIGPDGQPKTLVERDPIANEAASGAQSPGRGRVAATGSQTGTYAGAALVLLLIGGGVVYATRRRSTTKV